MKVRIRKLNIVVNTNRFNVHSIDEVITGDDSVPTSELDVWLDSRGKWMDMNEAFRSHSLIVDNYNTYFFEPRNEEEKARGYSL